MNDALLGSAGSPARPEFTTTHWSQVHALSGSDSQLASAALEQLCQRYWYPLYTFVRRKGYDSQTAKDLVQEFFARLLQRRDLERAREEKGRFRSYLLAMLKHFLVNEGLRAHTEKRGGGRQPISIDEIEAERRYDLEPRDPVTPELIYERRWATALLESVLRRLGHEYQEADRQREFELLKCFLTDDSVARSQAEIAQELRRSENAVKQAVFRLKTRYRELLQEEVARTVSTSAEVNGELRYLIAALRR